VPVQDQVDLLARRTQLTQCPVLRLGADRGTCAPPLLHQAARKALQVGRRGGRVVGQPYRGVADDDVVAVPVAPVEVTSTSGEKRSTAGGTAGDLRPPGRLTRRARVAQQTPVTRRFGCGTQQQGAAPERLVVRMRADHEDPRHPPRADLQVQSMSHTVETRPVTGSW
jgi:hypothetical protein